MPLCKSLKYVSSVTVSVWYSRRGLCCAKRASTKLTVDGGVEKLGCLDCWSRTSLIAIPNGWRDGDLYVGVVVMPTDNSILPLHNIGHQESAATMSSLGTWAAAGPPPILDVRSHNLAARGSLIG